MQTVTGQPIKKFKFVQILQSLFWRSPEIASQGGKRDRREQRKSKPSISMTLLPNPFYTQST